MHWLIFVILSEVRNTPKTHPEHSVHYYITTGLEYTVVKSYLGYNIIITRY